MPSLSELGAYCALDNLDTSLHRNGDAFALFANINIVRCSQSPAEHAAKMQNILHCTTMFHLTGCEKNAPLQKNEFFGAFLAVDADLHKLEGSVDQKP